MSSGRARALLLAACLSALGCEAAPEAGSVLALWAMGQEGEVVERMMPEFERRHAGVRVRVQRIPWSAAHEKLLTAYVGDAMPDVFQAGNTWLPELAALHAIERLDERIATSAVVQPEDYFAGIYATNVIDGATYGVPWYVDTRVLFYRTDLLAAAGATAPPPTWDAWRDAMVRITSNAGGDGYAILLPMREWQPPVILALQLGAELLRDEDRYGNFQSAPFRRAFTFYLDLFRRGLAPLTGEASVANLYQDFARGYLTMLITGPWNLGEFDRRLPVSVRDRWGTAPLPAPEVAGPGVSLAGGASLAIARGSRHVDAAWKLVEYLSEPAQQVQFYRLTGDLPARRSAWQESALADEPRVRAFWLQLQAVRSTPKIPEWERIAATIARYTEAAIRGELTPDAALAALDRDVDTILEKRRWLMARRAAGEA